MQKGKVGGHGIRLALIALAFIAAAGTAFFLRPRPLVVAFDGVDAGLTAAVEKVLDAWGREAGVGLRYVAFEGGDAAEAQTRAADAVFLYPSRPRAAASSAYATVAAAPFGLLSVGLRQAGTVQGRAWALPVLADTTELAWSKDLFGGRRLEGFFPSGIFSEAQSISHKTQTPVMLAGGDDDGLIDLVGLLVLERGGSAAYDKLANLLESFPETDISAILAADLGGFSLASILKPLDAMTAEGLVHANWLDFTAADRAGFLVDGLSGLSLQTLSFHRALPHEALDAWGSAALSLSPGRAGGTMAVAQARLLSLARPAAGRRAAAFHKLEAWLVSSEGQSALQAATGLAPTASSTKAADIQANDARTTISGSFVVEGMSLDGFLSARNRKDFATALRLYLMSRNH